MVQEVDEGEGEVEEEELVDVVVEEITELVVVVERDVGGAGVEADGSEEGT